MMLSSNAHSNLNPQPLGAAIQDPVAKGQVPVNPVNIPLPGQQRKLANLARFLSRLPQITGWMHKTVAQSAAQARPVADFGFVRLGLFFSPELLASAKVVIVNRMPVPPLAAIELPEFCAFGNRDYSGITFNDTYFLQTSQATNESAHFHELVHVIQWAQLGVERFLSAYAASLEENGYWNNPMEAMAYELQDHFDRIRKPFDVETFVHHRLDQLFR
jgi:hypothetical protein